MVCTTIRVESEAAHSSKFAADDSGLVADVTWPSD